MKKLILKNKIQFGTGFVLGAIAAWEYFDEKKRQTQVWNYNSHPKLSYDWDKAVRILTNPLMKAAAGGIVNHFYDWVEIEDKDSYHQKWLTDKDDDFYSKFKGEINIPQHALAHSRLGVQTVYTLSLNQNNLPKDLEGYHYAFQVPGMKTLKVNRLQIKPEETVKILKSSGDLRVLALDKDGNELEAIIEGPFQRSDKSLKNLRQL